MVAVGGVASRLTVAVSDPGPPSLVATQVNVAPGVSNQISVVSQPDVEVTGASGSHHAQFSDTLPRYQPSSPASPFRPYQSWGGVVSVYRNAASIHADR